MTPLELCRYKRPPPPFTGNRRKKAAYHAALKRDGFRCARCGTARDLTMHHKLRRADGGLSVLDNLETLCCDCHRYHHEAERELAVA